MMITSLLALALTSVATGVTIENNHSVPLGDISLSTDKFQRYYFTEPILNTSTDLILSMELDLHYDDNYNEFLSVHYDVNFTNNYCRFENQGWFTNNYNVVAYSASYLMDEDNGSILCSWVSNQDFLGIGDYGFGFDGDSDVMNVTFDTSHTYTLNGYIYLSIVDDYDFDELNTGDYQSGYNSGYQSGLEDGESIGQQIGYDSGYQDGYTDGNRTGYNSGYSAGLSYNGYTFKDLFASIGDTPILMIRRLFGFELFGTSLISVFLSLFTALVVIFVIKRVFK